MKIPGDPEVLSRGWEDILEPGEKVLWQDAPAHGLCKGDFEGSVILAGVALLLLAMGAIFLVIWGAIASGHWKFAFFAPVLLPLLWLGVWLAGLRGVMRARQRRFTTYSLTNRRAFVAVSSPWFQRSLEIWPIQTDTHLPWDGKEPGRVTIAIDTRYKTSLTPGLPVAISRVQNAKAVHWLIQQIQKGNV